jgi:DNA-binding CsgD family transcriptional regulator
MVAIPVVTWERRARSGSADWEQVRLHPHWSARVLDRCRGLHDVALVAGRHHERRDGSGYPFGLSGDLGRPAGIVACAVLYDELTACGEESVGSDAVAELTGLADGGALDRRDVVAVLDAAGHAVPRTRAERPAGLTAREVVVLGLLARGQSNSQIAAELGVSAKTVGAHVEHIYLKADVHSRAAATLFAMQHDLLG